MTLLDRINQHGYELLPGCLTSEHCYDPLEEWDALTHGNSSPALLRTESGSLYGARNLFEIWPGIADRVLTPSLRSVIREILGDAAGLVRVLFFDKPPEHSWALPWHRDLRIAIRQPRAESSQFGKPTLKYGIPHREAPDWLLDQMLTLRLHLDPVDEENGPLRVVPGSHRKPDLLTPDPTDVRVIDACMGDVLLMRPRLLHASHHSLPGTTRHRRIFHFECSAIEHLPDEICWHDFVPLTSPVQT